MAQVEYKVTTFYDAADERGIAWDDPALAIPWPVRGPILSTRDQQHPRLEMLRAGQV
jgi:dTDP-4-dehydrorhamnose 3,5-epimerase